MDRLTDEVRQEPPWTVMFAYDIVICSESREQVEEHLDRAGKERRSRVRKRGEEACADRLRKMSGVIKEFQQEDRRQSWM